MANYYIPHGPSGSKWNNGGLFAWHGDRHGKEICRDRTNTYYSVGVAKDFIGVDDLFVEADFNKTSSTAYNAAYRWGAVGDRYVTGSSNAPYDSANGHLGARFQPALTTPAPTTAWCLGRGSWKFDFFVYCAVSGSYTFEAMIQPWRVQAANGSRTDWRKIFKTQTITQGNNHFYFNGILETCPFYFGYFRCRDFTTSNAPNASPILQYRIRAFRTPVPDQPIEFQYVPIDQDYEKIA